MKQRLLLTVLLLTAICRTAGAKAGGGIPGEFATNYAFSVDDAIASNMNPSQLMLVTKQEATLINTFLFEGTDLLFLNYSLPLRMWGTASISTILLYGGTIEGRDAGNIPIGDFSDIRMVIYKSYAHRLRKDLMLGVNLKTIYKSFAEPVGNSLSDISDVSEAGDLGITYIPLKNMYVGLSLLNLFHLGFTETAISDRWPTNVKLSIDYLALNDQLAIGLDTDFMDLVSAADDFQDGAKALSFKLHYEMEYYIRRWFSLRGAFDDKEFNFGLCYIGNDLLKFGEELEFNYVAGYNYNIGQATNRLAVTARWGLSREEAESQRLSKIRQMAPINAFEEAMRLYRKKQYWDASYAFGKVVSLYPEFKRVDEANFYIAESFYSLGFEDAAEYSYRRLINEYPDFGKKDECIHRLQNIYYKRLEYDKVEEYYRKIAEDYPSSKVLDDAGYLVGQVYMQRGDIVEAMDYYKGIGPESNVYRFAQYALGIAFLTIGDSEEAVKHLKNVVATPATHPLDQMICDRASVTLGHLYFEMYDYTSAIPHYQKVSAGSQFYDQALIGHGWALVNEMKYKEALAPLGKIINETPNSIYVNEAHLVKGYCYTLVKDYKKAAEEFNNVISKCKTVLAEKGIDPLDVPRLRSDKEIEVNNMKDQLLDVELSILESVLRKPSKQRDEDARKFNTDIDEKMQMLMQLEAGYQEFLDDVRRVETYQKLMQDAEYAAATAEHLEKELERRALDKKYEDEIKRKEQELLEKLRQLEGQ